MHEPKNHNKLKALYEFYSVSWKDQALDEDSSEDDKYLESPYYLTSLKTAIAKYPTQALYKLFTHLGLVYSRIEEEVMKYKAMNLESEKSAEK